MGGKIFNVEPISAKIALYVQQAILAEIHDIYPDLECLTIGSVGKKNDDDYNSDIDIAIKCESIEELQNIISDVFDYTESVTKESLYIVSIKYPYMFGVIVKWVQCDFMLMHNKDYTAFRYYCPDYRKAESKYRVGAKIMFTDMLLNHVPGIRGDWDDNFIIKADFRPTGLYRYVINKDKQEYLEEFVTDNPKEIAKLCFIDSDINHFNTVESLWEAIHSPVFASPNEVKIIERNWFINCWRKGWTSIVPEDFDLQYWTNEEIWKYINKQKLINKINNIFQQGKEI